MLLWVENYASISKIETTLMKIPNLKKKHCENCTIRHLPNHDNSDMMIITIYTESDRKYGTVIFQSVKTGYNYQ